MWKRLDPGLGTLARQGKREAGSPATQEPRGGSLLLPWALPTFGVCAHTQDLVHVRVDTWVQRCAHRGGHGTHAHAAPHVCTCGHTGSDTYVAHECMQMHTQGHMSAHTHSFTAVWEGTGCCSGAKWHMAQGPRDEWTLMPTHLGRPRGHPLA